MVRLLSGDGFLRVGQRIGRDQRPHIGEVAADPPGQIDDTAFDGGTIARLSVQRDN